MHIVFAHSAFPAQFGSFGTWLARQGWAVTFLTADTEARPPEGCQLVRARERGPRTPGLHVDVRAFEIAALNSRAFGSAASSLRHDHGLVPDIVMAHSGLGVGSFSKAIWPEAHYVPYMEWFYHYPHVDRTTDAAVMDPSDARALALSRNVPALVDLAIADMALCPTRFQAEQFPEHLRGRMTILHDGVNCRYLAPDPEARFTAAGVVLPEDAQIITYATRGMELHRGFPQFMRALQRLQQTHPKLHALIGGADRVAYGAQRPEGDSWKTRMLRELDLDMSRVHFTGLLSRADYRTLLQVSDVHVYFTVPFVLSWSLIEAMSVGCALVASDVAPVREALDHARTALLVDHDDTGQTVAALERMLANRDLARSMGAMARREAIRRYDSAWLWPARAARLAALVRERTPI